MRAICDGPSKGVGAWVVNATSVDIGQSHTDPTPKAADEAPRALSDAAAQCQPNPGTRLIATC
ncbi:MAG: hypothetical protein D6690_16805 [Nitrospirae bacterium]|nr:MAG: hypothetical protein D6690_16805 [Nitrospirota bacterium]